MEGTTSASSDLFEEGMWPEYCNPLYLMPDEIQVQVNTTQLDGKEHSYSFPVKIEKMSGPKPYIGGYRSKITGRVFHNAGSQTPRAQGASSWNKKTYDHVRSRETQTVIERSVSVQLTRESGSQMQRPDLVLDNKGDRVLMAKAYFSSEQLLVLQIQKVVELQRYWRGYMARCLALRKKERIAAYEKRLQDELEAKFRVEAAQREEAMRRQLHPTSNDDFAKLYNELDSWRKEEVAKIKANTEAYSVERTKAMNEVLFNETQVLQSIRKLKVIAKKDVHEEKTMKMLQLMAQPYRWQCGDGKTAYVQTPIVGRSKELLELYTALTKPFTAADERLDVLVHVKWSLGKHQSDLTKETIELINREADLLNRGRSIDSMCGLRARIKSLFLQFIEDPKYNPRAAEFTKMVGGTKEMMSRSSVLP